MAKKFAKTNMINFTMFKKLNEFLEFHLDPNKEHFIEFFERRVSERRISIYVLVIDYKDFSLFDMKGEAMFLCYDGDRFVDTSEEDKADIYKESGFFEDDLTFYYPG